MAALLPSCTMPATRTLLITDEIEADFLARLKQLPNLEVQYYPYANPAEFTAILSNANIILVKTKTKVDATLLEAAPQLRLVVRAGAGLDNIDLDACTARGVRVENTPGANALPVGEQALGMLLCLLHRIVRADGQVRRGLWLREENRGLELTGRTVGIVGYGHTGQAFARVLAGFGCTVLACDKYRSNYSDNYARQAEWDELFEQAEVLSLHVPLTAETTHLVTEALLRKFARPIWLLNLCRGPVVHTPGLLAALRSGQVLGAALDVQENENLAALTPEQQDWLRQLSAMDNVVLTPHIGGWSVESARRINEAAFAHISSYLAG